MARLPPPPAASIPVVEQLNQRFYLTGQPTSMSNSLALAGILAHSWDGWEIEDQPWRICPVQCYKCKRSACPPDCLLPTTRHCRNNGGKDRVSTFLAHHRFRHIFNEQVGGVVIHPDIAQSALLCAYIGDGNTRNVNCDPGSSPSCGVLALIHISTRPRCLKPLVPSFIL